MHSLLMIFVVCTHMTTLFLVILNLRQLCLTYSMFNPRQSSLTFNRILFIEERQLLIFRKNNSHLTKLSLLFNSPTPPSKCWCHQIWVNIYPCSPVMIRLVTSLSTSYIFRGSDRENWWQTFLGGIIDRVVRTIRSRAQVVTRYYQRFCVYELFN